MHYDFVHLQKLNINNAYYVHPEKYKNEKQFKENEETRFYPPIANDDRPESQYYQRDGLLIITHPGLENQVPIINILTVKQ